MGEVPVKLEPIPLERLRENLAHAELMQSAPKQSSPLAPYRAAAAVLSGFDPRALRPYGKAEKVSYFGILDDCEPAEGENAKARWRLRSDLRKAALKDLATAEAMRAALEVNSDQRRGRDDPQQRMIDAIIKAEIPPLSKLTRDELAALVIVREWFDGIIPVPSESEIRTALPFADLLSPFQKLAGQGLFGRERELSLLANYVGVQPAPDTLSRARRFVLDVWYSLTERPPLFIQGPGGVGKSALLARFILNHLHDVADRHLACVYLDVDRTCINPESPYTFVTEGLRQLAVQFPSHRDVLERMCEDLELDARKYDTLETAKLEINPLQYVDRAADFLNSAILHDRPLLFIIDTFEEVQFRGSPVIASVWRFLETLQARIPHARIVIAGRAPPDEFRTEVLALGELDDASAVALIRKTLANANIELRDDEVRNIIALVGRNPLALKLGSQVFARDGADALRSIETKNLLFLRARTETVQAQLFGRILAHIHDDRVRKLAYPGLVLRRITPEIIERVLAEPCGITLKRDEAETLFDQLAREVALVMPDGERAVLHRPEVRALMLSDLLYRTPPELISAIDEAAVRYYTTQSDSLSRAEEIYHRLRLGQLAEAEARWIPGIETRLRTALDDLPPQAKLWLSRRLGVTPDAKLRAEADLGSWEAFTAEAVHRHLRSGDTEGALKKLRQRKERSPESGLFRLEAEVLHAMGRTDEARRVAARGLQSAVAAGNDMLSVELQLLVALFDEAGGDFTAALNGVDQARRYLSDNPDPTVLLRLLVTEARLLRKIGEERDRDSLVERSLALITEKRLDELGNRPALLREVVAEFGAVSGPVLQRGLDVIGLELNTADQVERFATALKSWKEGGAFSDQARSGSSFFSLERLGEEHLMEWIKDVGVARVSRTASNLLSARPGDQTANVALTEIFRRSVDNAIQPMGAAVRSGTGVSV
jgi:cellulose synthase operon protein C